MGGTVATAGEGLSIVSQPIWVQARLNSLQDAQFNTREAHCACTEPSSMDQLSTERLWQQYFKSPTEWWDNRIYKDRLDSPDFRHKTSKEVLWLDDRKTPEWVKKALEKGTPGTFEGGISRNGSHSFGTATARNAVCKRLLKATTVDNGELVDELSVVEANKLMQMYVERGSMVDARHVFDNMGKHNVVSWNIIILGYAKQEQGEVALELYTQMHQEGVQPSARTFLGALKACSYLGPWKQVGGKIVKTACLEKGRAMHFQVVKSCFESDVFIGTTLVAMYVDCGSMKDARCVFEDLSNRNVISWNAMILGYAEQEEGALALELYAQMHQEGVEPTARTFLGALKAYSNLAAIVEANQVDGRFAIVGYMERGRDIHSQVIKSGFESNVFVGTMLVDMYSKCGSIEDARFVFDKLLHRDVISWNAMIMGYTKQEEGARALDLYARMQKEGVMPDHLTFVGILKACGNTASLESGKEIHSQISRVGLENIVIVANSLIDMYAKCGSMVNAHELFNAFTIKDVVTWNSLIAGFAQQGESELVFHLFERMRQESVQPDALTFLSVLTVCSHVGLVEKGQEYFKAISKQHGIIRTMEHYSCMVDLFGRAGQVTQAVVLVEEMPLQPNAIIWLTVLGACKKWNNVEVGMYAFQNAMRLDEKRASAYVLMANLHAGGP